MIAGTPRRAGGWSLVEASIGMALFCLLLVFVSQLVGYSAVQRTEADESANVDRGHRALLGYALRHAKLPMPVDPVIHDDRPGYVEGWLPNSELGLAEGSGRLRYIANAALTRTPPVYKSDSLGLVSSGLTVRTAVNGLDLCGALLREEAAATALPGGLRVAFGVQTQGMRNAGSRGFVLAEGIQQLSKDYRDTTLLRGYGELSAQFGCFPRLLAIANGVRSAAVFQDLLRLARQDVAVRELQTRINESALRSSIWREVNWTISETSFAFQMGLEIIEMDTTLMGGAVKGVGGTIAWLGVIAGVGVMLQQTGESIKSNGELVTIAKGAETSARQRVKQLELELQNQIAKIEQFQQAGLQ